MSIVMRGTITHWDGEGAGEEEERDRERVVMMLKCKYVCLSNNDC